jgi:hypothetical protein
MERMGTQARLREDGATDLSASKNSRILLSDRLASTAQRAHENMDRQREVNTTC